MTNEEKMELKEKLEAKGITWEQAEEDVKVSASLLKLYFDSYGPVPVRIIKGLNQLLE